jgi:hypothetical protein
MVAGTGHAGAIFESDVENSVAPTSPIRKPVEVRRLGGGGATLIDESPASENSFNRGGVQRCLEPALVQPNSSVVCASLAKCERPVQEILPFFHVTVRACLLACLRLLIVMLF